jgi:DHA1 family bicyclomycin/chloramphenicol resistance-like MFS transporter
VSDEAPPGGASSFPGAGTAPAARPPDRRTRLILLLGALTAFPALSTDLYLPALPTIARELETTLAAAQTTLSVFFLGLSVGQLLWGPLSDRFGRRRPLFAGIATYLVASLVCAFAPSIGWLWAGRLGQAFGGCAAVVIARATVRDSFDVVESARVFSRLMLVMGAAPILAPLAGAWLLGPVGWRGIFGVLVGFGALALAAAILALPETHGGTPRAARPATVARTFGALLADRTFRRPALTAALGHGVLLAYIAAAAVVLIGQYALPPTTFGWLFGLNAVGFIGAAQLNARLLRRHPPERLLRGGATALSAGGLALLAIVATGAGGWAAISACWFVLLTSLGFVTPNASARALAGQAARAGSASALLGALQFGIGSASGAVVAALTAWPPVGTPARAAGIVIAAFALACYLGARGVAGMRR